MRQEHFDAYLAAQYALEVTEWDGDEAITGTLTRRADGRQVPLRGGVPRFVADEGYAENFSLQWNTFRITQLDSYTGKPLYFTRFWWNTRWKPKDLYGKRILEVGSGAGAFTEVLLASGAQVVSFDMSGAVDANRKSNLGKGDLFLLQADIYDMPFADETFDYVFCYGVLQHTPDPPAAYRILFRKLRPGGRISVDHYAKRDYLDPWYQPKYAWRPITTRMEPAKLLRVIERYVPLWLPIDMLIRRIPVVGPRIIGFLRIPCWNHYELKLGYRETVRWAIMNTFDALGAKYDFPMSPDEVRAMVDDEATEDVEIFYGSNGVVANVRKRVVADSGVGTDAAGSAG